MPLRSLHGSLLVIVAVLVGASMTGCSTGVAHPVDPDRAMVALKATLDAWKEGKSIDSLQSSSPPIVAQDMEWTSGARLLDYHVDDGKPADANLDVRVKLTLNARGKKVERDARYLVTTSPAVTVFRDMMR
ncbi:hypothetical protein [Paludisphaera rhizosphaerae]|uniref:hypothetical protein n=1 Tax=Paludisphaera rhizosphaerae TaxID=2711216 RepID=UPI0013EA082E|nr:hypothetical protein [Paludisphaera rhizosphaerae]